MATNSNRLTPARAIHTGEILREELKERGITQREFALSIGVQPTHLNEFIKGKRNLNEDWAIKFEAQLGIPYSMWMSIHNNYIYECNLIEAKRVEHQHAMQFEAACTNVLNLNALYKRLNLLSFSIIDRVAKIKEMFNFDLLSSNELRMQVAGMYKHSDKVMIDEKNMLTWLVLNLYTISNLERISGYQKGNAILAAKEIANKANNRELTIGAIKDILSNYGIGYAYVEKLDKTPIDAYSTFIGEMPVITVTYRYNDMDKLAFDILHELCHIHKHFEHDDKAFIAVEGSTYSDDPREKEANEFAQRMLIPDDIWNKIIKAKTGSLMPYSIVKAIAYEAERYGISPSIAIARYKHDTNWYRIAAYQSPKIY